MSVIDSLFPKLRTLNGSLLFFRHGWGTSAATRHETFLHQIQNRTLPPPQPLSISYTPLPLNLSIGHFTSPASAYLPSQSHTSRFLLVPAAPPPRQTTTSPRVESDNSPPTATPAFVLHLAATGDHGFARRYLTLAHALRHRGITSVILESPFYNARRPRDQTGSLLNCVHHLPDLGRATIEEARALLAHFRRRGFHRQVLTGVSQGGLHAAMTAAAVAAERSAGASYPKVPSVVMAFAPHSAVPVFTDGVMSHVVDWRALGEGQPLLEGDVHADAEGGRVWCRRMVVERLRRALAITDIANFPAPEDAARHVLVFAESDRYVTKECVGAWRKARPNVEVQWVPGGHVTAALLRFSTIRQQILEVLDM